MARRRRNALRKGNSQASRNRRVSTDGCPDDAVNDGFIDGLDHTAFHVAEQMRELTEGWKKTGYTPLTIDLLPVLAKPLVRHPRDMRQLGRYILKWMDWYLARDIPSRLSGRPTIEVCEYPGSELPSLIIGFETQSEASRN